jgi:gamma-carbonic anhydrase
MLSLSVEGVSPEYGEGCWFAPNSTIVGHLTMGKQCTVWFNAVIRADVNKISIGNKVNIQDGAVIHCTYLKTETIIGDHVSIGHNAIVHGCIIEENVLIGMGAIIMDGARIGANSIIGAGAVVTQNTQVPPNTIWVGNPAKYLKDLDPRLAEIAPRTAENYIKYASWFKEEEK